MSLVTEREGVPYLTVLSGVMLQGRDGRASLSRGDEEEARLTLYIPFTVDARTPAGGASLYLPPREWLAAEDRADYWTLIPEGEGGGRCSFFAEGRLAEPCTLAEARRNRENVWTVAAVSRKDYGSPALRHWEVATRVAHYWKNG